MFIIHLKLSIEHKTSVTSVTSVIYYFRRYHFKQYIVSKWLIEKTGNWYSLATQSSGSDTSNRYLLRCLHPTLLFNIWQPQFSCPFELQLLRSAKVNVNKILLSIGKILTIQLSKYSFLQ